MRPPAPWHILDVDLAERDGPFDPGIDRPALTILRYRGAVLGRTWLLPSDLPMTAAEFAELAGQICGSPVQELVRLHTQDDVLRVQGAPMRPDALAPGADALERLDAALSARRARPVSLTASIVICTRQRPQELAACLDAIAPEIAAGREVIVIDNGPDDVTRTVAETAGARYDVEPRPGVSRAKNRGIAMAQGDVVVCVDDDVRPEPGWIEPLLRRFDAPDVGVVTGLVLPAELDTDAQIGFEHDLGFGGMGLIPLVFDSAFLRDCPGSPPLWEIGAGANMAIRREVALKVGGFDPRVGPGVAGGAGDDTEFWQSVLLNGFSIRYEPLSVVRHKHRDTLADLKRQAHGYGKGHIIGLFVSYARTGEWRDLRRVFLTLPRRYYARRLLRAPLRWLKGDPDRLLWSSLRGYFSAFGHIGMAFSNPAPALTPDMKADSQ